MSGLIFAKRTRTTDGRTQLSLCGCCCKPTDRLRRWDALGVLRSPHPSLARRERSLCLGKRRLNVSSACCGRRYGSLARSPLQLAPLEISESSFSDQKPDGKKWRPPARPARRSPEGGRVCRPQRVSTAPDWPTAESGRPMRIPEKHSKLWRGDGRQEGGRMKRRDHQKPKAVKCKK